MLDTLTRDSLTMEPTITTIEDFRNAARILIVAAHPDDEVIGAGGHFPDFGGRLTILHVTSGSPRDLADALRAGCSTREEYAALRREEAFSAAALGGIAPSQFHFLDFGDQETADHPEELSSRIRGVFEHLDPSIVITHPYEGGHPDHDTVARAVAEAARGFSVWEFTSYHATPAGVVTGKFLDGDGVAVPLSEERRERKQRMLDCFVTQAATLRMFSTDVERFRPAPKYDFAAPPHSGPLYPYGSRRF